MPLPKRFAARRLVVRLRFRRSRVKVETGVGFSFQEFQAVLYRVLLLFFAAHWCCALAVADDKEEQDPNQVPKQWKVKEVARIVDDLKWELDRLRRAGDKDAANRVGNVLVQANALIKGDVSGFKSETPSLHVVAFGAGKEVQAGNRTKSMAEVNVTYTAQPVVLVLCGRERMHWKITLAKDVRLARVVLGGMRMQTVEGQPKDTPVDMHFEKSPGTGTVEHAGSEKTGRGLRLGRQLKTLYNLPIVTFSGFNQWEGDPIVVGPESEAWRVSFTHYHLAPHHTSVVDRKREIAQQALRGLRVRAPYYPLKGSQEYKTALADFDCYGPIRGTIQPFEQDLLAIAPPDTKGEYFALRYGDLRQYDKKKGRFRPIAGRLLWHSTLAIDQRRRRVLLASDDRNELVAYHLDEEKWSIPYKDIKCSFVAMAYDPESDRIFGLQYGSKKSIAKLDVIHAASGKLETLALIPPIQLTNLRTDREGMWSLVAAGSHLLVLEKPQGDALIDGKPAGGRMWVLDAANGVVLYETRQQLHDALPPDASTPLSDLWEELRTSDKPGLADRIMWQMAARKNDTVEFLRDKFTPTPEADEKQIAALIVNLDSADFNTRLQAAKQLERLGRMAAEQLKAALEHESLEVRDQAKRLLEKSRMGMTNDPQLRRELRAVHILGRIATDESRALLQTLAAEENDGLRTHLARVTSRRSKPIPPLPPVPEKKPEDGKPARELPP